VHTSRSILHCSKCSCSISSYTAADPISRRPTSRRICLCP